MVGAFNGLVGRAVAETGFDACYVSGFGAAATAGQPDIGLLSYEHMCRTISEVGLCSGLPVMADADAGFGEEEAVVKTVCEYYRAGAAGLQLEDTDLPKTWKSPANRRLVPLEQMVSKVRIAAQARDQFTGGEFMICARTEPAESMDAAIARAKAYIGAGADMIFPDVLSSEEEYHAFSRELGGQAFLMASSYEFGKSPLISVERFKELGYNLVMYPVSAMSIAMKAVTDFLHELKANGTQAGAIERMQTRQQLYNLLHYTPGQTWVYPNSSTPKSS